MQSSAYRESFFTFPAPKSIFRDRERRISILITSWHAELSVRGMSRLRGFPARHPLIRILPPRNAEFPPKISTSFSRIKVPPSSAHSLFGTKDCYILLTIIYIYIYTNTDSARNNIICHKYFMMSVQRVSLATEAYCAQ